MSCLFLGFCKPASANGSSSFKPAQQRQLSTTLQLLSGHFSEQIIRSASSTLTPKGDSDSNGGNSGVLGDLRISLALLDAANSRGDYSYFDNIYLRTQSHLTDSVPSHRTDGRGCRLVHSSEPQSLSLGSTPSTTSNTTHVHGTRPPHIELVRNFVASTRHLCQASLHIYQSATTTKSNNEHQQRQQQQQLFGQVHMKGTNGTLISCFTLDSRYVPPFSFILLPHDVLRTL